MPGVATASPDQSVAWQNNVKHDGYNSSSQLVPPLTLKWKHNFSSQGVVTISYPLIAQGLIFITTATDGSFTKKLIALDEQTGRTVWSKPISGTYSFANAAYDSGKVFVVNFDGLMKAFDAPTGALLWSVSLPGQYAFTSPPTAINGTVFVGGAGSGGTLYAVNGANGAIVWTQPVENGDHSSPAVSSTRVYVSYSCPQAYGFDIQTGALVWHYSGGCAGGGGKTPVLHDGKLYVRDNFFGSNNGLILTSATGRDRGEFNSDRPPAFAGTLGVYFQSGTLRGINIKDQSVLWSFAGSGDLSSPPLIVNDTIYIGGNTGTLYALNLAGHQVWQTNVGSPIPAPDEQNATLTTGLGAGDGLLVIPTGAVLAAYGN